MRDTTMTSRSPQGTQCVSPADRNIILASGVAVVECSWARLEEIPFEKIKSPNERLCTWPGFAESLSLMTPFAVPFLIAANPVNWGKRER